MAPPKFLKFLEESLSGSDVTIDELQLFAGHIIMHSPLVESAEDVAAGGQ
jgi:hypothetical protein